MNPYLNLALQEAIKGIENRDGAPFGACIVKNDQIIAIAHDTVLQENDATCHAEMNAIRIASRVLVNRQLADCVIYCTSEPCPMCLSAIHWSGIRQCFFIAERTCATEYGFDDGFLYDELIKPVSDRTMAFVQEPHLYDKVKNLFELWKETGLPLC